MEKRDYLIMLMESQGLTLAPEKADEMATDSGLFDTAQLIRSLLYQLDVEDARPIDDLKFDMQEDAS